MVNRAEEEEQLEPENEMRVMFKKRQKALNVENDLKRETKLVASAEPTDNALAEYHLATENEPPATDDRAAAKTSETAETTQPPTTAPPSQRVAEAPQQTHQYAGLLSRLGSALIDSCIIALVGAALMIVEALPFCKIGFSGMAEYLPDWLRGDRSIPWLLFLVGI
ncbi:hypothetical protein KBI23_19355 [bacterium]|nr:hypothetical protein [bacterium]